MHLTPYHGTSLLRKCAIFLCLVLTIVLHAEEINWDQATELFPGVKHLRLERTEPRLEKINIMRVDLTLPGLQFTITDKDPDYGKPMPDYPSKKIYTKRQRTIDFMRHARKPVSEGGWGMPVFVAANSAPWSPWVKPYNHEYAQPAKLMIRNGEVIIDHRPHSAIFVVFKDGTVDIVESLPEEKYADVQIATSGFDTLLKDGEFHFLDGYGASAMPRIAYGLSQDRHYWYIITVDGRQENWSMGATGKEVAELLAAAGAYDVVNMDGGGSATLCYWDTATDSPVVLNQQTSDGYTRPVGTSIGIYLAPEEK